MDVVDRSVMTSTAVLKSVVNDAFETARKIRAGIAK